MKALTIGRMASARLRANRKSYITLAVGIFLSIFLVTTLCLCVQGVFLGRLEQKYRQAGYLDMFDLDNPARTDADIDALGVFDRVGHISVVGEVHSANLFLGYGDETGLALLNYRLLEGRFPENAGEIAMERTATLALEQQIQVGDTVSLTVTPIDGLPEQREFTLVGLLQEKSQYLQYTYGSIHYADNPVTQFPAILLSPQEPTFATGRIAVHRVMDLKPGVSLGKAMDVYLGTGQYQRLYFINAAGMVLETNDRSLSMTLGVNEQVLTMLIMVILLLAALLTGCCVGIAVSMETILSKRWEEIGILRALGATRRQIRRIFSRESLILTVIASPASIACGCLCTAALQWLMPEQIRFRANPWLLLPIGLLSISAILLSGAAPLARASKAMPMSILRDTELLRKTKGLRSRKSFRVPRLLALRRLRLHPTRQLGAIVLSALMLVSIGGLFAIMSVSLHRFTPDAVAFDIYQPYSSVLAGFFPVIPSHTLTWQDIAQIAALPGVKRVDVKCGQQITLLTEGPSSYFPTAGGDPEWYEKVQTFLQTDMDLQPMVRVIAYDLAADEVMQNAVQAGRIDWQAVDSGEEVIVYAPTWWQGIGGGYYTSRTGEPGATKIAGNDYFYPGQILELCQLAIEDGHRGIELSDILYHRVAVTVGAVVDQAPHADLFGSSFQILTTPQGIKNLGFLSDGIYNVEVYLSGIPDEAAETYLEQSITAIARRGDNLRVSNQVASARENLAARRSYLLLFGSVGMIFFAAAMGLTLSGITRQLQQDARTIGMLRAVGANSRAIAACYHIPILLSNTLALGLAVGLLALLSAMDILSFPKGVPISMFGGMGVFSATSCLLSQGMLYLRIREIARQSIIETIREL